MNSITEDILMHYGIKRRSGRYPYGSGKEPYQHGRDFIGRIEELRKNGWTETPENIMKEFGMTTTQYRTQKKIAKDERRALRVARAKALAKDGLGATEIGKIMGVNESTVRGWFDEEAAGRMNKAKETAEKLKARSKEFADGGMLDVGTGVERELGISRENLKAALKILEDEGYGVYKGGIPQVTNKGQQTNQLVLCPPEIKPKNGAKSPSEIYDFEKVHSVTDYTQGIDDMTHPKKFQYPASMDSKRLMIRYNEEGGLERDGTIELRRGVEDLSLGSAKYSQVRILVDGSHYMKGMAIYSDNMPDGVDVIFNTNKKKGTPMGDVLKKIKTDPDNPFGSNIKDADQGGQYYYTDKNGKKKLGLINKARDEGDWSEWKDSLPSQFLAKQNINLIKKQLKLATDNKLAEYDEICSLTNPTVKKHLLQKFADNCDSAAVTLQAAALPRQKYHVILPINTLKDKEVYAPGYEDGTQLALIRYPHAGTFEIPVLTVNNKNALGKKIIGSTSRDAIGITSKIAEQLSGADFDGDTVMCIPTNDSKGRVKISHKDQLKELRGFDSKSYRYDKSIIDDDGVEHLYRNGKEFKRMNNTGKQMGVISNLITDMTLAGGATDDELARAVRHSMVVIDAEKHKLDYRQSEIDNDIAGLKEKYQPKYDNKGNRIGSGGAATILSKAKSEESVPKRQGTPKINIKGTDHYDPTRPEGSLIYKTADDAEYTVAKVNKRTGEVTYKTETRTQKSTKMLETDDAMTLISDAHNPKEVAYAIYANDMKALANKARVEMVNTGRIAYDKTARDTYSAEVKSLMDKLNTAEINTPRERAAQRIANVEVKAKKEAYERENGEKMKKGDIKKISQQALSKARTNVASVSRRDRAIDITDREWEAIQAGAISESKLKQILDNTNIDSLRARATPRTTVNLSSAKINQIKSMSASNYTLAEIANKLGVSTSTVSKYL